MRHPHIWAFLAVLFLGPQGDLRPDPAIDCADCAEWNAPREPYRIFGNTYYVGVAGLSALLVTSERGHVLLDGGLPQSAPRIEAGIRALGFRLADVRLIVNSHTHYDHAGGIAALQRASGAAVAASAAAARALERGGPTPDDPQFALGEAANRFPAVAKVKVVAAGEVLRVGDVAITAHATPGHTPGGTTWTWRSCEAERCLHMVYADSLTAVSAPGFRFSSPGAGDVLRRSIAKIAALPCDVVVSTHPAFTALDEKRERRAAGERDAFVDPGGCRAYAAGALKRLEARLADEQAGR